MRILVTGGTGLLGGRLIPKLAGNGHQLTIPMPEQFSLSGFDDAPKTDRLFFAIFPDAAAAARIAQLAQRLRSEHGLKAKPLGTERFHITLHHLGDYTGLPQRVVAEAMRAAATIAMPQFELTFDRALAACAMAAVSLIAASRSTGRPDRSRATYPAPILLRLPYRWPRVSGGASETPPLPSCAAPGGSFLHVS
jgi:hypothetical protein